MQLRNIKKVMRVSYFFMRLVYLEFCLSRKAVVPSKPYKRGFSVNNCNLYKNLEKTIPETE